MRPGRIFKVGDIVWTPVTDHPDFPSEITGNQSYLFRDKVVAERMATAWNSYGGTWHWYAKSFVVPDEIEGKSLQMALF